MKSYCSNKASKEKIKRIFGGSKSKNISQKNILPIHHTININDDVIMNDENVNPNIVIDNSNIVYENKNDKTKNENIDNKINDNIINNDKKEENELMQIESEVKDMKLEETKDTSIANNDIYIIPRNENRKYNIS